MLGPRWFGAAGKSTNSHGFYTRSFSFRAIIPAYSFDILSQSPLPLSPIAFSTRQGADGHRKVGLLVSDLPNKATILISVAFNVPKAKKSGRDYRQSFMFMVS